MTAKEKQADLRMKRKYGVGLSWYNKQFKKQNKGCAICGRPPKKVRLHIDHNHTTGKVRGLLCHPCNRKVLGAIERFKVNIPNIVAYLMQYDSANPLLKGADGPKK